MSPNADIELKLLAEVKQYETFTKSCVPSGFKAKNPVLLGLIIKNHVLFDRNTKSPVLFAPKPASRSEQISPRIAKSPVLFDIKAKVLYCSA